MTNSACTTLIARRPVDEARRFAFRPVRSLTLAVAILVVAGCLGTSAALASTSTTLCVHDSDYTCPAGSIDEGAQLQQALNAASLLPASPDAPNVIDIGPGVYSSDPPGFSYASSNPLRIIGSGTGSTILLSVPSSSPGVTDVLALGDSDTAETVSVSDLSLTVDDGGGTGLALTGGTADDIDVGSDQTLATGVVLDGATLSGSTVESNNFDSAVQTGGQPSELDDDTLSATPDNGDGVLAKGPTTIHRVKATAMYGLYDSRAQVSVDDSLVEATWGLASYTGSISALNDTLIGTAANSIGVISNESDVRIVNSIIHGFPNSFVTQDGATIEANSDNWDGGSSGTGISRSQQIGADPGFVNAAGGDYHLAWYSSLIDASAITSLNSDNSSTDLDDNPRVVVDGNAGTPVDIGAYEYQHRAPDAQATATPSSGAPGTVFSFDSAGSHDPDDGDYLSYSWTFDDGTIAAGSTASHAFTSPGQHTGVLTVTDSSGLTSTATATVNVTGPVPSAGNGNGAPGNGAVTNAGTPGTGLGTQTTTTSGNHSGGQRLTGRATLRLVHHSVHGETIAVTLSCGRAAACNAITLTETTQTHHHMTTLAKLHTHLRAGQTRTFALTLSHSDRALLASLGKLAVTIAAGLGNAHTTTSPATAHATIKA